MIGRRLIVGLALATVLVPPPRESMAQDPQRTHTVVRGETLFGIASRYGLRVDDLRRLNRIEGDALRVGQVLRLDGGARGEAVSTGGGATRSRTRRAVAGHQSIVDLAVRLGAPPDSLLAANPDLPDIFEPGDSVLVPAAYSTTAVRVRSGDTLFGLANRYGTTVEAIRRINGLRSDRLAVGQVLEIPAGEVLPDRIGLPPANGEGAIIRYPDQFAGRLTASGMAYDPTAFVLAHPGLALGTVVLLEVVESGDTVFAEVADRMPVRSDRLAEVSAAVFDALGRPAGTVRLYVIDTPTGGGP